MLPTRAARAAACFFTLAVGQFAFNPSALAQSSAPDDPCTRDIRALYEGGALDPFAQPPYRYETTVFNEDGSTRFEFVTVFDTPLKSMSGLKGQNMTLAIGRRTWTGPSPDGPWTETPNQLPEDLAAFHKANRDQLAANLRDTACPGLVEVEGKPRLRYDFTTQTDPNPDQGGTYFGASYSVFIDPDTGHLMRQEQTGPFAHYQPQPGTERWVMVYSYDPAISLSAPAE
ncbi:hypothetical protein [Rhodalgimonas zhirmunskyi]|uniref:Secreted protein n=1 Tax=Rhodalgimonas zhirmunskyi TaxID=2964767 RepID=A0AAJ1UGR4_9RHOB|nr:hypothetical protein [Rhodoalgimonas zhirmunskyi]MDQ2095786.1 hypothetical protein [Rhodoalgimonas zhirmunskyi]